MLKFILYVFAVAATALPAAAHDFWLEPTAFEIAAPGVLQVHARVGHKEDRSAWATYPSRIVSLTSIGPDGITDQRKAVIGDPALGLIGAALPSAGFHILTLTSTHAVSELPAEKFNAYVAEEGVLPILADRETRGTMSKAGREIYSRRGKTLLRVGQASEGQDAHITRPLGLTLEIVPLQNPLLADPATGFEFEVRFRGDLVPGATVHLSRLDAVTEDVAPITTGKDGRATFASLDGGAWMLHTVWSSPLEGDARGDYDTTFSSLTFAFNRP